MTFYFIAIDGIVVNYFYLLLFAIANNFKFYIFLSTYFFLVVYFSSNDIWKTLWMLHFFDSLNL